MPDSKRPKPAPGKSWWLLALCGVLEAIISVAYLIQQNTDLPVTFHAWHGTITVSGKLMLAAGACTIAAGLWTFKTVKYWLLVLNGIACSALGAIFAVWRGPLGFRTVALLIVVMAISIAIYELAAALNSRHHLTGKWLVGTAGVVSVGFALAFLGFVFRWMRLNPGSPAESLYWLGFYFGFSAICMLGLAAGRRLQY